MKSITALKSVTWDLQELKEHYAMLNRIDVEEVSDEDAIELAKDDCDSVNWTSDVKEVWITD